MGFNMLKLKAVFLFFLSAVSINGQDLTEFIRAADGQKFPEGPAWDGKNSLYSSNCYGDWITRISGDKTDTLIIKPTSPVDFGKTNGLAIGLDGNIYACDYGLGAILRISPADGTCDIVSPGYNGEKFTRPNDLAFDDSGNIWFTDPENYDAAKPDGEIYYLNVSTGEVKHVFSGLAFPNGIALNEKGDKLYVCESAKNRVLVYPVKGPGELGDFDVFAELPGGDPDGIAFDVQGNLYVAHFGGGAIQVFSPDGKLLKKIATPGIKPSNLEFAGEDMKKMYLTEDETNAVYLFRNEIPGLKLRGVR